MISDYPHKDTIVVRTDDLDEFKSLCDRLGVSYDIYARPSNPADRGNCLIQLSMDDMNLISVGSDQVDSTKLGMRQFMGACMRFDYDRRKIELCKIHAVLDEMNTK